MEKGGTVIHAGPIDFAMSYRQEIMDDQGLCLQVYSKVGDHDTEILRFDCFDQNPHYHYGPANKNERIFMDKTTTGNPLGWTLKQLRTRLPQMIQRAGYEDIAESLDTDLVASKLDELEACGRELAAKERKTVVHNRGDEVIEAGNVKFGLEFREIPRISDRGLAIHVLSDVAGQEIELLAFDCFENRPHYHYGTRNKDIRYAWDKTVAPDPLKWTLDQFKEGKLPSMVRRAGYPAVADAMDANLVVTTVAGEVEPRALAIRAANAK
jgi:hypothetical protein